MTTGRTAFDTEQFREAVYQVTQLIPKGQVATYSQIATYVLSPRHARAVGNALKNLPRSRHAEVPWQRVINAAGRISHRGETTRPIRQERLLRKEGVDVDAVGRVDLRRYQWAGPPPGWTPPFREPEPARASWKPPSRRKRPSASAITKTNGRHSNSR